jgi:hypothetical protein
MLHIFGEKRRPVRRKRSVRGSAARKAQQSELAVGSGCMLTKPVSLEADCEHCAALCCVALAFDRSSSFAFDKPAGTVCPHVTPELRCAIHATRVDRGFAGCSGYDCLGAGQRVTQELFGGRTWRSAPELMESMFEAFRVVREIHELLLLLRTAKRLPLDQAKRSKLRDLTEPLESMPLPGALLGDFAVDAHAAEVRAFLRDVGRNSALRRAATQLVTATRTNAGARRLPLLAPMFEPHRGTQRAPLPSSPTNVTSSRQAISPSNRQAEQSLSAAQARAQNETPPARTQAESDGQSAELAHPSRPQ